MIFDTVLSPYVRMYVLIRTIAARNPYAIEVNCSKAPSVFGVILPCQLDDDMRILRGLLLRYPRGRFGLVFMPVLVFEVRLIMM